MTPRRPRSIQSRAFVEQVHSVGVQDTLVIGRIMVNGVGEMHAKVYFPALYQNRPLPLLQGIEMDGESPEVEHIPDVDSAVVRWLRTQDDKHINGAEIAIRVGGSSSQRLWVSYGFFGSAMSTTVPGPDPADL